MCREGRRAALELDAKLKGARAVCVPLAKSVSRELLTRWLALLVVEQQASQPFADCARGLCEESIRFIRDQLAPRELPSSRAARRQKPHTAARARRSRGGAVQGRPGQRPRCAHLAARGPPAALSAAGRPQSRSTPRIASSPTSRSTHSTRTPRRASSSKGSTSINDEFGGDLTQQAYERARPEIRADHSGGRLLPRQTRERRPQPVFCTSPTATRRLTPAPTSRTLSSNFSYGRTCST